MSTIKKLCLCAVCIALCYVLPAVLHPLNLGQVLSPLHFPVLVCGLICGPIYGAACGIAGPILSSVLSGMPAAIMLPSMLPELMAYGMFGGILMRAIRVKSLLFHVYLALIPTMLIGRLLGALSKAIYYFAGLFEVQSFNIEQIATAYFVTTLPAIIVQLLVIPMLIVTLKAEKIIKIR